MTNQIKPQIESFTPREAGPRDWGVELIIAETPLYLGKLLRMKAGGKGGLQYHVEKDESFYLLSGNAWVRTDDGSGQIKTLWMRPGETFHIPPGAVHQVEAVTECVFLEVSTPHYDDRVRVESEYGLDEDGGLPTTK